MKRLRSILLVDDDAITNFLHETIITELDIAENIEIIDNGEDAFQYLKQYFVAGNCPELIFLDLNMPIANGFEFLESYKLLQSIRGNSVIIILSSSSLRTDMEQAESFGVNDFVVKPLTSEKLKVILEKHFDMSFAE